MRACRTRRPRPPPNFGVHHDVGEPVRHMLQMPAESFITAAIRPGRRNLRGGVAEHGTEPMFDPHRSAKFLFDRLDARLRDIGPHAQNVGEVGNFDLAHRTFLVQDGDVVPWLHSKARAGSGFASAFGPLAGQDQLGVGAFKHRARRARSGRRRKISRPDPCQLVQADVR